MAYNAVAQVEVASESESDLSRNPSPSGFQRVVDRTTRLEPAKTAGPESQLGAIYRSMTSSNYDVVEADDYDADPSPKHPPIPPLNTAVARHSSPDPPLRSASSDIPIPLSHPTPDLQSLQGAYAGNVERLEQSAERLSSSTADIASEIRKLDQEQKRRSYSSASNSVIMRNGAFSPGASLTRSPHGSTRSRSTRQRSLSSGSCLAQVAEPAHDDEGHFLDQFPTTLPIAPQFPLHTKSTGRFYGQYDGPATPVAAEEIERPDTAASGDTFQQARTLFTDFDGVHFAPWIPPIPDPPLASKPELYKEAQADQNMVYYPAPVPRMLNLPPKLSRRPPIAEREKRRTQILTAIAAEDRKAKFGEEGATDGQKDKRQSQLPQQLRASVFFDPPSTTLELEVKQESAVATLDSILDASAHAPVSAFTDHPYAGHVGSYVYGQERKTLRKQKSDRNSQFPMGQQQSTNTEIASDGSAHSDSGLQQEAPESGHPQNDSEGSDVSENEGDEHSTESEDDDEESDYVGPPNTLLAELELRKHELAQRRRTVVPQYTPGMQNTLLELDAMAQKQSEKRRRRPVTLAWGNRHAADDDDVPLAMLYPEQVNGDDPNQPRGLMEKHHVEEHEPLSTRRARLRGEPIPEKRPVTVYAVEKPQPAREPATEDDAAEDGETLAERLRRLKGQNPAESEFSNNLLAEFDNRLGSNHATETASAPQQPPEEETLAQRRIRLQKQSGAQPGLAKNPRERRSMAALPQVRPSHVVRKSSHDVFQQPKPMQQYGSRMSLQQFPTSMGYPTHANPASQPPPPPYSYGPGYPPPYGYNNTMIAMHNMGYPMPNACGPTMTRQPVDPNQRDVIDRWRQSIR
ncbi:uncharacterized protein N7484_011160 [Penicillium longicatenatum]|uniref:uncharacterized protein n=1 Tax=Penicillium longicatenatum TaxID=1561947 RepID=UPI002549315C|nr:uncharacterized protein N7484_011160 [Penicillium longicatenatum]KAJ5631060.1 hypothetical protein N7484_011160 [Penicillium longicatenatum]